MQSAAVENYLKATYSLQLEHGQVTTSMLADRIGHAAPTVTGMLKKLASRKLVSYEPYQGVTLTKSGRAAALEVIRHHRLLETYLTRALGIPWDRVHDEAEKLEHVLSEYLEGHIDEYLGHPASDPHGSPIPSPDLFDQRAREIAIVRSACGILGASRRGGRPGTRSAYASW